MYILQFDANYATPSSLCTIDERTAPCILQRFQDGAMVMSQGSSFVEFLATMPLHRSIRLWKELASADTCND